MSYVRKQMIKVFIFVVSVILTAMFSLACSSTASSREEDTTVLYNGSTAYLSDLEYGLDAAELYYVWRNEGTPDVHTDAISFKNGTDFLSRVAPETVSLTKNCESIVLMLVQRPDDTEVTWWSHLVNLEKQEGGTWVRQAILDIESFRQSTFEWAMANERYSHADFYGNLTYDNTLQKRNIEIAVEDIYPALTPGNYRILFYLAVQTESGSEYRQYAIPFYVIE